MPLEHAVQHHHGQEGLRPLVQQRDVLGAQVLAAAHPVLGRRPAVVHPGLGELQRRAADVQHERRAALGEPRPERIEVDVAGRAVAARPVRHPDGLEAALQHEVELGHRQLGLVERHDGDAHQPRVARRRSRPCAGCGRAPRRSAASGRAWSWPRTAWRRCGWRTPAASGSPACPAPSSGPRSLKAPSAWISFEDVDQLVAQRDLRGHVLGAVAPALPHDHRHLLVGDDRGRIAHLRDVVAQGGVGVALQEVRQLHDVAVGVVDRPSWRSVGHGFPPGSPRTTRPFRRRRHACVAAPRRPGLTLRSHRFIYD